MHVNEGDGHSLVSNSSLPYPTQRQTESVDVKKIQSTCGQETFAPPIKKTIETRNAADLKNTATHNRGYVNLNAHENATKKKAVQRNPPVGKLPSRNLQTDAAPSDASPHQESGKRSHEHQGKHYYFLKLSVLTFVLCIHVYVSRIHIGLF